MSKNIVLKIIAPLLAAVFLGGCMKSTSGSSSGDVANSKTSPSTQTSKLLAVPDNYNEPNLQNIQTIGGLLTVSGSTLSGGDGVKFSLNGKPIPRIGGTDLGGIVKKFNINGDDVVLVTTNCSGSSCTEETDNFLIIKKDGSVSIAKTVPINKKDPDNLDGFFDCGDGASMPVQIGNTIQLECIEAHGREVITHVWTYKNGVVTESRS